MLETSPGHLLRINPDSTHAHFAESTSRHDVEMTCGHLVSITANKKGVDKTPLNLMGSEIENALKQNTGSVTQLIDAGQSNGFRCASGLSVCSGTGKDN